MTEKTLRRLIATVMVLLVISQIGHVITSLWGTVWGILSVVIVALVSFFASRKAKADSHSSFWFLLPMVLFTLLPLTWRVWRALQVDTDGLGHLLAVSPFLLSFGIPMCLLVLVYYTLRKREAADRNP